MSILFQLPLGMHRFGIIPASSLNPSLRFPAFSTRRLFASLAIIPGFPILCGTRSTSSKPISCTHHSSTIREAYLEDLLSSCSPSLSQPPGPSPTSSLFLLLVDPLLRFDEVAVELFSLSLLLRDLFSRLGVGLLLLLLLLDGRDDLGFSRLGVRLLLLLLDGLLDRLGERESSE
jgi:hypothetical protein